jgi:hypothetical protein
MNRTARSSRHSQPGVSGTGARSWIMTTSMRRQAEPLQAVTVRPDQTVTANNPPGVMRVTPYPHTVRGEGINVASRR